MAKNLSTVTTPPQQCNAFWEFQLPTDAVPRLTRCTKRAFKQHLCIAHYEAGKLHARARAAMELFNPARRVKKQAQRLLQLSGRQMKRLKKQANRSYKNARNIAAA